MTIRSEQLNQERRAQAELYLAYAKDLKPEHASSVSTAELARAAHVAEKEARLTLAAITDSGQLRATYPADFLIRQLEQTLGHHNLSDIVLLGSGPRADDLLANASFSARGFRIVAAFTYGKAGGRFRPAGELVAYCQSRHIHLGIIATAAERAEQALSLFAAGGVLGIWNVSGAALEPTPQIAVENENFGEHEEVRDNPYVSLSVRAIARSLADRLGWSINFDIEKER